MDFNATLTKHTAAVGDKAEETVGSMLTIIKQIDDDPTLTPQQKLEKLEALRDSMMSRPLSLGSGSPVVSPTDQAVLDTFGDFAQATGIGVDPLLRMLQPVLQPLAGLPLNEVNARLIGAGSVTKGDTPVKPDGRPDIKTDATLAAENDRLEKEVGKLTTKVTGLETEKGKLEKELKAHQDLIEALQQAADPTRASSKAKARALHAAITKSGELTADQQAKLTGKEPVYTP